MDLILDSKVLLYILTGIRVRIDLQLGEISQITLARGAFPVAERYLGFGEQVLDF
jgi:hypothetical protein